jgi:membrane protease YdiL (CAAX protease family)
MIGSALLFASYAMWHAVSGVPISHVIDTPLPFLQPVFAAFLMGLILGLVRERSQSILPPILFQATLAATYISATHYVF